MCLTCSHPLVRRLVVTTLTAGGLMAGPAQAQTPPEGRLLASNCFQCHGTNGKGPGFDTLAGKSANEIYQDLLEFRSGNEGHGIMTRHALGYTNAQLRSLAKYLSTQR
jgi:cytochrome subunit of sulfide dehydrogenase